MEKEIIKNETINEQYYKVNHKSGLTIYLYKKEGYSSSCAMFGTKYGSIDSEFRIKGEDKFTKVPDGIAHYLEHKLFESEEKDAFNLFAQTGASANAYTSFDRTAYYFTTTKNFFPSLGILLDFVTNPYFTDENVNKERGIIGQEIKMYDDDPNWKVLFNCLEGLYKTHPVKVDIAGDINSIEKIDKELLYKCYDTFYNMNNMVLVAAGDFDIDKFLEIVDKKIKVKDKIEIEKKDYSEPSMINKKEVKINLSVSQPLFCIGFKLSPENAEQNVKKSVELEVISELMLGDSSDLFEEFYQTNLVSGGNIVGEVFLGRGYCSLLFEGESKDPQKVHKKTKDEIEKLKENNLNKEEFELAKKSVYGKIIRSFSSPQDIANSLLVSSLDNIDFYKPIEIIKNLKIEDVKNRLQEIDVNNSTISIVSPI